MKSVPIKTKSLGQIQLTLWQGEYEGKPTYSYTVKKSYKNKSGEWVNTDFFNKSDLPTVLALVQSAILGGIKAKDIDQKPAEQQNYSDADRVQSEFQGSFVGNDIPY